MIISKINTIKNNLKKIFNVLENGNTTQEDSSNIKMLIAKSLIENIRKNGQVENIHKTEFKVFSQFGDDGIIQYLLQQLAIKCPVFIEFGVENYTESNTRFLLMNNNWKGLVIDADVNNINHIKKQSIYWKYDIKAICSFITKENINQLFIENGFEGEIGVLSIDLDGNDYWIWEAINVVNPIIVIAEYNSVFGSQLPISVPYNKEFVRSKAHYSYLYWGASLSALSHLALKKGYKFIGCNSNGNNAYFIRNDMAGAFKTLSIEEGYVESKFRESRDESGNLNFLSGIERIKEIENCEVINVITNQKNKIKI